ncbi:hypothetical protein [Burkholderia contaminans]|uniref:hypothetical protein n=1 Tax=Burkholderia contaminans TaxID=488447 RepID=UPI003D66F528
MKVTKHIKRMNEARNQRSRQLIDRIARTNDTGYSDGVVLAVMKADRGPWSKAMTVEELLASLGKGDA